MIVMEPDSGVTDLDLKTEPCLVEFRDSTGHLMIAKSNRFYTEVKDGITSWNTARCLRGTATPRRSHH